MLYRVHADDDPLRIAALAGLVRDGGECREAHIHTLDPESPSAAEQLTVLEAARADAARQLYDAILGGTEDEILAASQAARQLGATSPEVPWHLVNAVESRVAAMAALRAALSDGTDEALARAWSHAQSVCPEALRHADNRAGRQAFRRWGRALRQQKRSGGRVR